MGSDRKSTEKMKSKKRSASPSACSSSQDERKRKRRRRAEEDEERKSRKRDKKDKKSHKHSSKHHSEKKTKDKHKSKHHKGEHHSVTKHGFQELTNNDYFSKNNEFATWLKDEKKMFFSNLSSEAARELFADFVKDWNDKKLEARYYEGIEKGPRTAHNWKIKQ